ncbi:hypothetical protein CR513_47076, partial [Mucuna pruriens]
MEVEERHRQAEERHLKAMKMVEQMEEELRQQLTAMKVDVEKAEGPVRSMVDTHAFWGQPFNKEIDRNHIPPNFRELMMDPFDGTQNPHAHLQAFQTHMYISGGSDALNYKLFPGTLRGMAI